jgi:hypothetical protein
MIQTRLKFKRRQKAFYEKLAGFKQFRTRWDEPNFGIFYSKAAREIIVFADGMENRIYCDTEAEFNSMFEALWIVWSA